MLPDILTLRLRTQEVVQNQIHFLCSLKNNMNQFYAELDNYSSEQTDTQLSGLMNATGLFC